MDYIPDQSRDTEVSKECLQEDETDRLSDVYESTRKRFVLLAKFGG